MTILISDVLNYHSLMLNSIIAFSCDLSGTCSVSVYFIIFFSDLLHFFLFICTISVFLIMNLSPTTSYNQRRKRKVLLKYAPFGCILNNSSPCSCRASIRASAYGTSYVLCGASHCLLQSEGRQDNRYH